MEAQINPRRVYISGEQVEIWENPALPFRCTQEEINGYAEHVGQLYAGMDLRKNY